MIRVEPAQKEIRPGERLTGRVEWNRDGGKEPRKIEIEFRWTLSGKGVVEREVVDMLTEHDVSGRTEMSIPFDFAVPPFGPLTYQGKIFSIVWDVTANVDLPFALDEQDTCAITVAPGVWTRDQFEAFTRGDEDEEEDEDDEEEEKDDE